MLPKISDIIAFFESEYTDIRKQSQWDFSGPQIYTGDRQVRRVALSLDPDKSSIKNAIEKGCELLITHHPLFFRDSKGIIYSKSTDSKAIEAIRAGLDILSYHTNIDMAPEGTNFYIRQLLNGEKEDGYISQEGVAEIYKFSVFVPYDYKEQIIDVLRKSGAGKQGNYSGCGFMSEGVGMFTPNDKATPFIGEAGVGEIVDEVKIETIVEKHLLPTVLNGVLEVHPYEEPAYDIIKLENSLSYGIGEICRLNQEYNLPTFVSFLKEKLNTNDIRSNIEDVPPFSRIGICTGSGASLWKDCLKKGVKVLLTGDMKYHDALDAAEAGVCIIDAGHQATEEIYLDYLSDVLKSKFNIEIYVYKRKKQIISWGI